MRRIWVFWSLVLALALSGCATAQSIQVESMNPLKKWSALDPASADGDIPAADREFRAAWVATVGNIDWPSKPGLTTEQQQAEIIDILNKCVSLNMNAVIFQVRPSADAMYKSEFEPWSYYLTGEQGKAPDPYYDPLQFWVEQAHARGIELHVWCNPYRVRPGAGKYEFSEDSVPKKHPHIVRTLQDGTMWMDPAMQETQDHDMRVIMDMVKRYDLDGVHFDDYFYPYPSYNGGKDFPDDETWNAYVSGGGKMSRGDWRRDAVNKFIHRLYTEIKKEKPNVKLGLSPFGLYRPGYPRSIKGFDQYEELYADALLWFKEGWVDYWTPQLYWPSGQIAQSFPIVLAWWQTENDHHRNVWPGIATYRVRHDGTREEGATADPPAENMRPPVELIAQIMATRAIVPNGPGHVHFSMKHLMRNHEGISDLLLSGVYSTPALVPPSPWLDAVPPLPPVVSTTQNANELVAEWTPAGPEAAFVWVVYIKQGGAWRYQILPTQTHRVAVQNKGTITRTETTNQGTDVKEVTEEVKAVEAIVVTAVDRCGNESAKVLTKVQ